VPEVAVTEHADALLLKDDVRVTGEGTDMSTKAKPKATQALDEYLLCATAGPAVAPHAL
jgi:hypothetical protein